MPSLYYLFTIFLSVSRDYEYLQTYIQQQEIALGMEENGM